MLDQKWGYLGEVSDICSLRDDQSDLGGAADYESCKCSFRGCASPEERAHDREEVG